MNKIEKFLKRLTSKERLLVNKIIRLVRASNISDLDVKKLRGGVGLFRVRMGDLRVIFHKNKKTIKVISIGRRSDNIYSK